MIGKVKKINIKDADFATICILQKDDKGNEVEWWYFVKPSDHDNFFKLKPGDKIDFSFEKKNNKSWIKKFEIVEEKLQYVPANEIIEEKVEPNQQKAINKAVALKCAIEYLKLWDLKDLTELKVRKLVIDVAKGFEKYLNS